MHSTASPPLDSAHQPRAVIIGAGVAGLAAAVRLGEGGRYRTRLFEREAEAGGLARSVGIEGLVSDLGPHRIHTELSEVEQFIKRIAQPSLMTVRRRSHIFLEGRFLAYPPSPIELTRHWGPLRMLRFAAGFARDRARRAPGEETYESLMRRAFGRELYEYLLKPYSAKTWKIDPADLHADTARVRVSAGSLARMLSGLWRSERPGQETSLKSFLYVRGGMRNLVRHMWEEAGRLGASLETGREVVALRLSEDLSVQAARLSPEGADQPEVAGDVFLSTAPLPELLGRLLPPVEPLREAREAAQGLEYLNMTLVFLVVGRPAISGDHWLYFPEPRFVFNRAYESRNFDPAMGTEGRSVLCMEITHRAGDPLQREPDEAMIEEVSRQIASTGLFPQEQIRAARLIRLPYAYPLYKLDYEDRLARALVGLRLIGNLITLGRQGLFNHNNMDHSIAMGLRGADLLNASAPAQAVAEWYNGAEAFKRLRIVD